MQGALSTSADMLHHILFRLLSNSWICGRSPRVCHEVEARVGGLALTGYRHYCTGRKARNIKFVCTVQWYKVRIRIKVWMVLWCSERITILGRKAAGLLITNQRAYISTYGWFLSLLKYGSVATRLTRIG